LKPGQQRAGKLTWPKALSERVKAVGTVLATVMAPLTPVEMDKIFARAKAGDLGEILEMLCAMGKARWGPASAKVSGGQVKEDGTFPP
jgi:hypothetical protein